MGGLRLEKGYRDFGVDIDNTDTRSRPGSPSRWPGTSRARFRGKAALEKLRGDRTSRLVNVVLHSPEPLLHGSEAVLKDGTWVGYVQVGGFGHTLGASLGLATVDHADGITAEWLASGGFEVVVAGVRYPATLQFRPLYDPDRARILC